MPPIHPTALVCTAVLGLLLFGLGMAVSGARGRARVVFVIGLLTTRTLARPSPLRFVGALATYVTGAWLAVLAALPT